MATIDFEQEQIVSLEELEQELDREARARLHISGQEFERLYDERRLTPSLAATELGILLASIKHARVSA